MTCLSYSPIQKFRDEQWKVLKSHCRCRKPYLPCMYAPTHSQESVKYLKPTKFLNLVTEHTHPPMRPTISCTEHALHDTSGDQRDQHYDRFSAPNHQSPNVLKTGKQIPFRLSQWPIGDLPLHFDPIGAPASPSHRFYPRICESGIRMYHYL